MERGGGSQLGDCKYRVTHLVGNNLLLTQLRHIWQLVGRYCSYLLPRHDGRTDKIQVNERLLPTKWATLYGVELNSCRLH